MHSAILPDFDRKRLEASDADRAGSSKDSVDLREFKASSGEQFVPVGLT